MILVDTNIIIDFWDKPTDDAKKIFEENEIATCGVIKTELLRGSNNGLAVPFQDAIIAYLAIKYNCEVWTNDKHFKLMQVVLPELKLFSV